LFPLGCLTAQESPAIRVADPLCLTRKDPRTARIPTGDIPAATLSVAWTPVSLATITSRVVDAGHIELTLQANEPGDGILRFLDPAQKEVARTRLQVVSIRSTATKSISSERDLPDGRVIFDLWLVMQPYVPGLDIAFCLDGKRNTLPDGLRSQWAATETCIQTQSNGAGRLKFRIVRDAKGKWVPYKYTLYQNGEEVGSE
jgi:hypothetical protein